MSALLLSVVGGVTGGVIVAASRETARYLRRRVRRLSRRRQRRAIHHTEPPSTEAPARDDARAAYRGAQVRAYANHLARGDVQLREQLRRFEKPINGSDHQGDDLPW